MWTQQILFYAKSARERQARHIHTNLRTYEICLSQFATCEQQNKHFVIFQLGPRSTRWHFTFAQIYKLHTLIHVQVQFFAQKKRQSHFHSNSLMRMLFLGGGWKLKVDLKGCEFEIWQAIYPKVERGAIKIGQLIKWIYQSHTKWQVKRNHQNGCVLCLDKLVPSKLHASFTSSTREWPCGDV